MAAKTKKPARPAHKAPVRAQEQKGRPEKSGGGKKSFDNTNRGALFLNDKDGNDARPDYTGILDIDVGDGKVVKFRVAGWIKTPNSGGDDYLSLSIQKADQQGSNKKKKDAEEDGEGEGEEE